MRADDNHHPHYDEPDPFVPLMPLCRRHHLEASVMNAFWAEFRGFKPLTKDMRLWILMKLSQPLPIITPLEYRLTLAKIFKDSELFTGPLKGEEAHYFAGYVAEETDKILVKQIYRQLARFGYEYSGFHDAYIKRGHKRENVTVQ